jgi:hypothetical protein
VYQEVKILIKGNLVSSMTVRKEKAKEGTAASSD